jgi:ABC-type uncharacterized transport system auxiliary subunit
MLMKRHGHGPNTQPLAALWRAGTLLWAVALAGCAAFGKTPVTTDYDLRYTPPALSNLAPVDALLSVQVLGTRVELNGTDMAYQPQPYEVNAYTYSRWAASPVTLTSSYLVRDFRQSGLFKGVFEYAASVNSRYLLLISLEEFREIDQENTGQGRISLSAALFDLGPLGDRQLLLFQKQYSAAGPEVQQSAGGLASSMSAALREVSGSLMADVNAGVAAARP